MSDNRDYLIRASEISQYVYCNRAWWLRRVHGIRPGNEPLLAAGSAFHARHARSLGTSRLFRQVAIGLLLTAALILLYSWIVG